MIIDTTLFNDEFDMLDIHLSISENYVDHWIILEANRTFSGKIKPYNLKNNFKKYKEKYGDRIEIVNLELDETQTNLICETMMRQGLASALKKFDNEDIVIHGDLDEIIDPTKWNEIMELMDKNNCPVSCGFEMYFYKFDQKAGRNWKGSVVAKKRMFETPHGLYKGSEEMGIKRKNRVNAVATTDPVGWHWTWMGNDEIIKNKVVSCIESQYRDPNQVLEAFKNKDTTIAVNHKSASEIIKPVYPDVVLDVLKKYPFYWHNPLR